MDGSSKAGLESTSTWVGWFFFFSVRVVTVATINVLREVLRDGCHLLRVQKALVFHAIVLLSCLAIKTPSGFPLNGVWKRFCMVSLNLPPAPLRKGKIQAVDFQ